LRHQSTCASTMVPVQTSRLPPRLPLRSLAEAETVTPAEAVIPAMEAARAAIAARAAAMVVPAARGAEAALAAIPVAEPPAAAIRVAAPVPVAAAAQVEAARGTELVQEPELVQATEVVLPADAGLKTGLGVGAAAATAIHREVLRGARRMERRADPGRRRDIPGAPQLGQTGLQPGPIRKRLEPRRACPPERLRRMQRPGPPKGPRPRLQAGVSQMGRRTRLPVRP